MDRNQNTFILFQKTQDENHHGANLPVAALVRLSERLKHRLIGSSLDVESDFFRKIELNVSQDDVRWLSRVAFDSEGGLARVDNWFDPELDQIIYAGDSENMEMDCETVDFDSACTVFTAEGIPSTALTLEKYHGRMLLGLAGETNSHWNLNTLCESWGNVAKALGEEAVETTDEQHTVTVVLGEAASHALEHGDFSNTELHHSMTTYGFATKAEADAFAKGMSEGAGWMEVAFPDAEEIAQIEAAQAEGANSNALREGA